ncbi:leucine-rich repeat domain-containing protein [Legionella fallonii]|uniref:Leucine-rich repeat domain-containing protein n=1 Tax=Legionella fallonii LLAP-10 TaxID=1212491 RepID=A0A098G4F4_9GAMM|nr:leucine-rich repeat domain-containing protein [Legionella fallonii]CEG56869.1 protein of unknown function [Coiled-coil] [Legionella fallonii LLAP-10]
MILLRDGKILSKVFPEDIKEDGFFDVPESVKSIGSYFEVFMTCSNLLTNVTLSKRVEYIGECAFSGCTNIENVIFEGGRTEIHCNAFLGCNIKTITLVNSTLFIDSEELKKCQVDAIAIFADDQRERWRIFHSLPKSLQDKVISSELMQKIKKIIEDEVSRITKMPEINPTYPYLNTKMPNEMFVEINSFMVDNIAAYLRRVPVPQNNAELQDYKKRVASAADKLVKKTQSLDILKENFKEHLKKMEVNETALRLQGKKDAADVTKKLCEKITNSYQHTFFSSPTQFKQECNTATAAAFPPLKQHSDGEHSLMMIPLGKSFLGISPILLSTGYQFITKTYSFFSKTDKEVSALEKTIEELSDTQQELMTYLWQ